MNEFIAWVSMHGYAHYVWPAYGLVFGVLITNVWRIRWHGRKIRKIIKQGLMQ